MGDGGRNRPGALHTCTFSREVLGREWWEGLLPTSQALHTWYTRNLGSLERFWGQDCCLQSAEDRVHIIWISLDLQKNLHFVLLIGRLLGTGTQWFKLQAQPWRVAWRVAVSSSQWNEQQQLSGSDPRECRLHLGSVGTQLGTALPWQKSQCLAWFLQPASTLTGSAYLTWDWRGSRGCMGLDNTCQFIQYDPEVCELWGVMCLGYTRCSLPITKLFLHHSAHFFVCEAGETANTYV